MHTAVSKHFKERKMSCVAPDLLEVRGEIYMELAEFQRLNQLRQAEGEPLYANPRNLAAGTVILTGTPHGVGAARKPPVFLKAGDTITIEIDQIGALSNPVIEELMPS